VIVAGSARKANCALMQTSRKKKNRLRRRRRNLPRPQRRLRPRQGPPLFKCPTIDSLAILQEKTKGNLNDREKTLMQNVLFELRMAWIEITNAVASSATKPGPVPPFEKK
jgi:hypothetical protein